MGAIAIRANRSGGARAGRSFCDCLNAVASSMARSGRADRQAPSDAGQSVTNAQVITARGDLRNGSAIRDYCQRCELAIRNGARGLILDLTGVSSTDSKLVAGLVLIVRRARAARVPIGIHVSQRLRDWIAICGVERLLLPHVGVPERPSTGDRGAMCA